MATSEGQKMKLYSYWRSSCSYRVRTALHLKGLSYEYIPVNLVKGDQFSPEFLQLNPIGYVPVLVDGDVVLADSFAILMYLEEKYPRHSLLPSDLQKRAIHYQAANIVGSSIQPLQNLAVLKYIEEKVSSEEKLSWVRHHIEKGFEALEKLLKDHAGKYATGDEVFLELREQQNFVHRQLSLTSFRIGSILSSRADLFLAPQIHAAIKRFNLDMTRFPLLVKFHEAYTEHPAFQKAMPENQPDAPSPTTS